MDTDCPQDPCRCHAEMLWTVGVADLWDVDPRTIRRWVDDDVDWLPSPRYAGKRPYWIRHEVMALMVGDRAVTDDAPSSEDVDNVVPMPQRELSDDDIEILERAANA